MRAKFKPAAEIEFAGRVGFLTRRLWREFFAKGGIRWQNKIWVRLKEEGYFRPHPGMPDLYIPNPKQSGLDFGGPFVAKPPSLNQLAHDEFVARSYLLLKRHVPGPEIKTEAYLKKESPLRNKGVRDRDAEKHPDLVLELNGEETAIEIELTQKSRARYRAILRAYRSCAFNRVLYIVRAASTMNAIEYAAREISFPRDQIQLGFGSMANWRLDPLTTKFHFENSTKVLSEVIGLQSAQLRPHAE